MSRLIALLFAVCFVLSACDSQSNNPPKGAAPATASKSPMNDLANKTVAELQKNIENEHPATYYILAQKMFEAGDKDEAVFWFYLGQLRYRYYLSVAKNLDPSGDPALFASLGEVVGRPLNEYAFGDIPKLAKTIDRVLDWDAKNENGFTPKKGNEAVLKQVRDGLVGLRDHVVANEKDIKAQRKANGLE